MTFFRHLRWACLLRVALSFLMLGCAHASLNSDLNQYFNHLGFSGNASQSAAYQGQSAGFYTGGSLYGRDRVRDVQLMSVNLPTIRSGCGGIDLFMGGFSFVNSQGLTDAMKSVMSNAAGYAFNLGLETVTPQIASSMKYIEGIANGVNRMNINSCETAAGLVGAVWPKTHQAQLQTCEDVGVNSGKYKDYAEAREACGAGGELSSTLSGASGPYQGMAFVRGNLAWKALSQNGLFSGDTQLSEFLMSISGTVILNNSGGSDGSPQDLMVLPSLATNADMLKALLHGGAATIYACDSTDANGCLQPSTTEASIDPQNALATQVGNLLQDMVNRIFTDQALTSAEIGLLNATRLPLYKMLNVEAAYGGSSVINVSDYADVIASDILFQYLDESLSAVSSLSASQQYPEALMKPYVEGMEKAREAIREAEGNTFTQISMTAQLVSQTETLERMLSGSLSTDLNQTLEWAHHLRG